MESLLRQQLDFARVDVTSCFVCATPQSATPCETCLEKSRWIGALEGILDRSAALPPEGRHPEESVDALKIEARNWRERCNVLVCEAIEHDDKHYLISRYLIDRVEAQLEGAEGRQEPEDNRHD